MKAAIKDVRDYLLGIVETTWPGMTYSAEAPQSVTAPPHAFVRLDGAQITVDNATITSDSANLQFTIAGRWATPLTSDQQIDKVSDLRDAILADHRLGGYANLSMVTEVEFNQVDTFKEIWDIVVRVSCYVIAARP